MSIKAIIWDFGGVLIRTIDPKPRSELAAKYGMKRKELEYLLFAAPVSHKAQLGEITMDEFWDSVLATLNEPLENKDDFRQRFWAGDSLDTNLIETISSLKTAYKTALLSNAWNNLRQMLSEEWKIAPIFDEIIISAEVGLMKPDPQIYQIALERLQVKAEEAVFLDDFIENVEGARKVGMHAIHFRNPAQANKDLEDILAAKG